jgi:hypothetical protein
MNAHSASELRAQAARCRRLASAIFDTQVRDILKRTAEEFENDATACDAVEGTAAGLGNHGLSEGSERSGVYRTLPADFDSE